MRLPHAGGYPPGPPLERIDFEQQADEVAAQLLEGDHLVGHSYGGVVSLLAAARRSGDRVAGGERAAGFGVAAVIPQWRSSSRGSRRSRAAGPREYLEFFLPLVGSEIRLPDPLPPRWERAPGGDGGAVRRTRR